MKGILHNILIPFENTGSISDWSPLLTENGPTFELFHYVIDITERGKINLYEGVKQYEILTRTKSRVTTNTDLWMLNMTDALLKFELICLSDAYGGFSRLIGNDRVLIMNKNFKSQMIIFDAESRKIYNFIEDIYGNLDNSRDYYGAVFINKTVVIIGG
jgi:hypothetical protein